MKLDYSLGPLGAEQRLMALPVPDGLAVHALGLADLGKVAAAIIGERGWIQGKLGDSTGAVCLHGALLAAAEREDRSHSADYPLVSTLYSRRGSTMGWNDDLSRSQAEVVEALERDPLSDREIAHAFGPQWVYLFGLNREVRTLAPLDERGPGVIHLLSLAAPTVSLTGVILPAVAKLLDVPLRRAFAHEGVGTLPDWVRAPDTELHAMNQVSMALSALSSSHQYAMRMTTPAAATVGAAAAALVLRHLLVGSAATGDREVRARVYDALTMPYRAIVGRLHPEDAPVHYRPLRDTMDQPCVDDAVPVLERALGAPLTVRGWRDGWTRLGDASSEWSTPSEVSSLADWNATYLAGGLIVPPMVKITVTSVT